MSPSWAEPCPSAEHIQKTFRFTSGGATRETQHRAELSNEALFRGLTDDSAHEWLRIGGNGFGMEAAGIGTGCSTDVRALYKILMRVGSHDSGAGLAGMGVGSTLGASRAPLNSLHQNGNLTLLLMLPLLYIVVLWLDVAVGLLRCRRRVVCE